MNANEYKDEFYSRYHSTHVSTAHPAPSLANFRESFPNFRKKYGRFLPNNLEAEILEAGCGEGSFVYWLTTLGYSHVRGFDLSCECIAIAQSIGVENVFQSDIFEGLGRHDSDVDTLVIRDVIEHFDKQTALRILKLALRTLRPGGRLILHVPNADSPFFGRIRYGDFTHEMAYSIRSLSQIFNVIGFENHQFVSDESAVIGLRSVPRFLCWKLTESIYKFLLASEVGFGAKIMTQNLIATADRPSGSAILGR